MLLARLSFDERWMREPIDLRELVTLRESGWTLQAIGERLGVGRTTVLRRLRVAYIRFGQSNTSRMP
jgi:hypothetical protein